MKNRADVVIIGGGIIGLAVAFYLAKNKFGSIVVVEKEPFLGAGSTAKAAGGIRAQFSNRVNIEMSILSERLFCQFQEDTGYDAHFDQVGYLFLLSNERDLDTYKANVKLQRSLGLRVELISPGEISKVAPHVILDDILAGTFCLQDGLGDPSQFLAGYEQAARKMGVSIETETFITAIETRLNEVTGVVTTRGHISTPLVINCAGAYAGLIASMIGADLPVKPFKRQCVTTGELSFVQPFFPMVVDVSSGLYSHKESKGLLLGWADKDSKSSFDVSVDPDYTNAILERALARISGLEEATVANVWAGLYETTPDHMGVIGWEPSIRGMIHACGFSGHGFMHAPATGVLVSELVIGQRTSIEITELRPDRFGVGELVEEGNVI